MAKKLKENDIPHALIEFSDEGHGFRKAPNIKKAIESKFDVKVLKVSTIRQLGKIKQMTVRSGGRTIRTSGKKSDYKKAIITLDSGSKIDIMRGETES